MIEPCLACGGSGGHLLTDEEKALISGIGETLGIFEAKIRRICVPCDGTGDEEIRLRLYKERTDPKRHRYSPKWCPDIPDDCEWCDFPESDHGK